MYSLGKEFIRKAISTGLIIVLAITLVMPTAFVASADTTTTTQTPVVLTLKTIDDMTSDSSLSVKLSNLAIEKILDDYYTLDAQVTKLEKAAANENDKGVLISLSAQISTTKAAREAKWKEYQDARENFVDVVTPQIANIKLQYMSYVTALVQEQKLQNSIQKSKNDLSTATKKLELKYISQSQYDTMNDNYDKLVNGFDSIVSQRKSTLEKLLNALSLGADATVSSPEMIDVKPLAKLDFASSLQLALTQNKAIKDAQDDLNDARLTTYPYYTEDNYDVKVAKVKLSSLQNTRTESFTLSFDSLQTAVSAYIKADALLQKDIKKATQMQAKYKLGYISKNMLDNFNTDLENEKLQLKLDNYSIMAQNISLQNYMKGY